MRVSEVFNPGGFPEYTYNPRNQLELEKQVRDYLDSGYKLLSLTGPTKSGKTVLCRQLISRDQGIWISGGDIREENDFWQAIINNLNLFLGITSEKNKENEEGTTSSIKGYISAVIAKVGSDISESKSTSVSISQKISRNGHPRTVAINGLSETKKPIIIDDFHYVPHRIQVNCQRRF